MIRTECFKIRILSADTVGSIVDLKKMESVHDVTIDKRGSHRRTNMNPTIIVADPFLFANGGCLYLFYEKKPLYGKGVIMMEKSYNMKVWSMPKMVLSEDCHLSYPFVFEDAGKIYMLPESGEMSSIRLYEATDSSLEHFVYKKDLLSGNLGIKGIEIGFADSSICKIDDIFYLNTSVKIDGTYHSLLLFSHSLDGPYTIHPESPICTSNKYGRNAGAWIWMGNCLLRLAQDCEKKYGDDVHIFCIENIDPKKYRERLSQENIIPRDLRFYRQGGHHLNFLTFKNKYVFATDAKEYQTLLCRRAFHKLGFISG